MYFLTSVSGTCARYVWSGVIKEMKKMWTQKRTKSLRDTADPPIVAGESLLPDVDCFCCTDLYPQPLPSPGYSVSEKEQACCLCVWQVGPGPCVLGTLFPLAMHFLRRDPFPGHKALCKACISPSLHAFVLWGQNQKQHPRPAWNCSCTHCLTPAANRARSEPRALSRNPAARGLQASS